MAMNWTNRMSIIRKLIKDGRIKAAKEWARELLLDDAKDSMLTADEFEYLKLLVSSTTDEDIRFLSSGDDDDSPEDE